jgi:hypothetical protein
VIVYDGFDDAIIGVGRRCGQPDVAVYDYQKLVAILVESDGMDDEEASEYVDYNIVGAWVGDTTPIILFEKDGGGRLNPEGENRGATPPPS